MAVGERRKRGRSGEISGVDVLIEGPEALLERVGKAFVVTARVILLTATRLAHQRRITEQQLIRPIAVSDPKFVGPFAVPASACREPAIS